MTGAACLVGAGLLLPGTGGDPGGRFRRFAALPSAEGLALTPRQRRALSPLDLLTLSAAFAAAPPRGGGGADIPPDRVGICLGHALGCLEANALFDRGDEAGADPRLFQSTVANAPAGWLSIALGATGPSLTFTGPSSGDAALLEALCWLMEGRVDRVFAGSACRIPPAVEGLLSGAWSEGAAVVCLSRSGGDTRAIDLPPGGPGWPTLGGHPLDPAAVDALGGPVPGGRMIFALAWAGGALRPTTV